MSAGTVVAVGIACLMMVGFVVVVGAVFYSASFGKYEEATTGVIILSASPNMISEVSECGQKFTYFNVEGNEYYARGNETLRTILKVQPVRIEYVEHNDFGWFHGDYCRGRFVTKAEAFP